MNDASDPTGSSDPFERAARHLERESALVERELSTRAEPEPALPAPPALRGEDLVLANALFDPTTLAPGARGRPAKRLLLRVLNLYTDGQVRFNGALVRLVNGLGGVLRELAGRDALVDERAARRHARAEERRGIWEGRFGAALSAAEDRVSELESREAEGRDDRQALVDRIDRLERSQRRLEAEIEALRRGGGTAPGERAGERVALLGEIAASLERGRVLRLEDDPFATLLREPDGSLGGLVLPESVESLPKDEVGRLLALARTKLRPGAVIVVGAH